MLRPPLPVPVGSPAQPRVAPGASAQGASAASVWAKGVEWKNRQTGEQGGDSGDRHKRRQDDRKGTGMVWGDRQAMMACPYTNTCRGCSCCLTALDHEALDVSVEMHVVVVVGCTQRQEVLARPRCLLVKITQQGLKEALGAVAMRQTATRLSADPATTDRQQEAQPRAERLCEELYCCTVHVPHRIWVMACAWGAIQEAGAALA